jgi:predicted glycoside hydrolase/deacetylase ChbG (UPF0249 family)
VGLVEAGVTKRLIINADDYNLTPACDRAIEEAYRAGVVSSASRLVWDMNEPVIPAVRCGVHLRLTDGKPILPAALVPSLVDRTGNFAGSHIQVAARNVEPDEVMREWRAQIAAFGFGATHLDTHRHTHLISGIDGVYEDLCVDYRCAAVPLSDAQRERLRARGVPCADYTEIRWTEGHIDHLCILLYEDFQRYETVHLMTHPGVADAALRAASSMCESRARELAVLSSPEFRGWLRDQDIEVIGMDALPAPRGPLDAVDIVFCCWNRKQFTLASLLALEGNTDWSRVRRLWLYDDGSTDGADHLLLEFCARRTRLACELVRLPHVGPVAAMNDYLTRRQPAAWWAKIDSDTVVPPGWLTACLDVLRASPDVDLLGIEPIIAQYPVALNGQRAAETAAHIGGIGLMRTAAFTELPHANGRMGFTDWQIHHPVKCAWLNPALPVILLDRLPFEPWCSLSAEYERRGWQRPWDKYREEKHHGIWDWWRK